MLKRGREKQQGNLRQEFERKEGLVAKQNKTKQTAEMFSWDGLSMSALLMFWSRSCLVVCGGYPTPYGMLSRSFNSALTYW